MNNEDIKYLDYEGLVEYHNNITGKIFIPTIDYIPNETTLTYIVNNKTFKFDVGDFVRVTNSTKESGFTFYQLYDITEQNEAIWGSYSEKTPPTYVSPSAKNLTYDGNPLELLNPGSTSEGTFQYSLLTTNRRSTTDSLSWSTSIPTATDANNYTVYWRLIGDESHADILPTAISVEIEKVTPTISEYPEANTLTYNELSQELITPGQTNFGTFQYSFDEINWNTEIPERINAGTYTVYYRILGDDNINTTETENLFVTISPKEIDNPGIVLSQNTYIYNGEECEPSVTLYDNQTEIPATEYTVSYQNNINAGTAEVIITDNSDGNYIVSGDTTFIINKANGRVDTLPTNKAVVYNSEPQVLANAGLGTGVMYYSLDEHDSFSTTIPSLTNAGTYTLYFYAAESANYLQSATQNITVTISKADSEYIIPQGINNLIYSGLAQDLLTAGSTSDGIMKYSEDGEIWSTDIPEGTNAAVYNILWKVFGDSNHNDSNTFTINISIAKVTPTVIAPTLIENLVYNGEAQELLNAGSTDWGTLLYSNDNEIFSTTIPTGTNAGEYDLWYKVFGNSNINDTNSVKLTNNISKANASYVAPVAKSGLIYNELEQDLLNSGSTSDGILYYSLDGSTWNTNVPKGINAGTYVIYWKIVGDSNHNNKVSESINVIIDKAAGRIDETPTSITGLVYNGISLNLINSGSGTGVMQYKVDSGSWDNNIPTMDNAGTYTIYYKVLESANYYATDGTDYITNSIAKVTPIVTAPTPRVLTYNTSSLELINAGSTNWGTLQYSLDNSTWSTNIPEATNYGSYTVYYRVVGNSNINDVDSNSVHCSIAEKRVSTPTIELDPTEYTYDGNLCEPSVVVKDGSHIIPASEYTITYSNNTNAGTATIVITDNVAGNYDITGTKDFIINKADGSTTAPTTRSLVYNGDVLQLINPASGTGTIYYRLGTSGEFSTTIPSATNAGSYTIYYYAAENSNYKQSSTNNITIEISKADPEYTSPTAKSLTYNENAQVLLNAGSTNDGIIQYSSDNTTWTTTIPSQTNAGTYTTYWKIVGDSNHNDKAYATIDTTIAKANQPNVPVVTGATTTYPTAATATVSGEGIGSIEWSNGNTQSTVGSKTTKARWPGNDNYNASGWSNEVTLTMNKATGSVTTAPVDTNYTYNGTARAVASNGSGTGTMMYRLGTSGNFSTTMPTMTNAGSNTLLYYAAESTNYTLSSTGSITVNVQKAPQAAPSVTGSTVTYGSTATASASGGGGQGSIEWSNGSSRTAVGYQDTQARWSGNANYNASGWSGSVRLQVNQAGGWVTASATNRTYNGYGQVVGSVSSASGTYYLGFGGSTTSGPSSWGSANSSISATNVGTYYIWAKCDASTNYTAVGAKYIGTATIGKANQNAPSASGSTTTYPTTATASASGGGGQGSIQWESALSQTSVGSHTTRARWTGNANYNASGWSSYVTVTMNKADQAAPTATGSTVYEGSTATATASGGGGQGSIEWSNGNTRTATGSQTTKARWSGNSNYNASPWSNEVTLTVQEKTHAGHDFVEIGGLKWATMNIGASNITDTGLYFQWGDTQGYTASQVGSGSGQKYFYWTDYKYNPSGDGETMTKYNTSGNDYVTLEMSDDAARANWGGSWRMPTQREFLNFENAVNKTWTANYQGSGVAGLVCTDKTNSSKVLFFPGKGYFSRDRLIYDSSLGYYWTSLMGYVSNDHYKYAIHARLCDNGYTEQTRAYRSYGMPVRAVVG